MICPVCDSSTSSVLLHLYDDRYGYPGKFQLLKCANCGHTFLNGAFSPDLLSNLYSNYYPRSAFSLENFKPHRELNGFLQGFMAWLEGRRSGAFCWVPANVSVLDIGCGFGESLGYHEARGCNTWGVEADQNIRRVADKFGFNVHVGLFDPDRYEPNFFDYVTMSQVIEHVTDPIATLRGIAKVLKPHGKVVLSTPNATGWGSTIYGRHWINWHTPYHLQFFSVRSLTLAAEKAGLIVRSIKTVTHSKWLCYQWIHLTSWPPEGISSSFWRQPSRVGPSQLLIRKAIMATQLLLLPQLITRVSDLIGRGDNYLIILEKK